MIDREPVCRNCRMPQRLHVSDRCLYSTTTFDPVLCRECGQPYLYMAFTDTLPPMTSMRPVHLECYWANK